MPINNLAIARRRMSELQHILFPHRPQGTDLRQNQLSKCDSFNFKIRSIDVGLYKNLKEAGFDINYVSLEGDWIEVNVICETPEKRGCRSKTGVGI